ncbi:MAG TPA: carboxypeptidase regulatory-like domain-containing protein [Longimicrobiaceae bacterium]|nr:carboxypeptidase regulatory-like domain-containing protein [Longimicrobiaceae bacterium]
MGPIPRFAATLLLLPVLLPLALHVGATRSAAQDARGATVTGQVRDVGTSEPLYGAIVALPDHRLRAVTDSAGRFTLRGVPAGEQRWEIRRLGYARWEESTAVQDGADLVIGLLPSPLALEEVRATESRLETRRRKSSASVKVVSRDEILSSTGPTALELVSTRALAARTVCPGMAGTGSVGGLSAAGNLCVINRGRVVPVMICIDEERANTDALTAYTPQEIHTIETYQGGIGTSRTGVEVRVYTNWFVASGRPLKPRIVSC